MLSFVLPGNYFVVLTFAKNEPESRTREVIHIQPHDYNGCVHQIKFEIRRPVYQNEPGVRQSAESVLIREEKPSLNGEEEWANMSVHIISMSRRCG